MTATDGDAEPGPDRVVSDAPPRSESVQGEPASGTGQIELTLTGDRRDVEALSLEFRRLAKAYGLEIRAMRVRPADELPRHDETEGGSS